MNEAFEAAREHYEAAISDREALLARIGTALEQMGGPVTAERLAGFDQFHIGGLASSVELARRVGITSGDRVLDAGSGLGGPSRFLAETFACRVVGVDLAPAYVAIARLLAEKAGLGDKVAYEVGSITALPYADASFDLVWTQHVVMNIPERDSLYREIRRVLKRGGRFAFYDPYLPVGGEPPIYPTPWAASAAASTLLTQEETTASCARAGLRLQRWDDVSEMGQAWIERQQQPSQQQASDADDRSLRLGWVLGARMQAMVANFARNVREGRIRLVMGICEAD